MTDPIPTKVGWRGAARRVIAIALAAAAVAVMLVAVESLARGGVGWVWPAASEWLISVLD